MNCALLSNNQGARPAGERAFTLAEVLAALLFMAIVIPVAMQGLRIASVAGEVAARKSQAARVAERLLTESLLLSNAVLSTVSGTVVEDTREFRYEIEAEPWTQYLTNQPWMAAQPLRGMMTTQPQPNATALSEVQMNLLTVQVFYTARGQEYSVELSTLVDAQ
jgi:type II secretory pathway pseudopilin PulG